jgi:hypothetical protein
MYPIVVLSLIAVALLAMSRRREGLEATALIKAPPYDDAEKTRILGMIPESEKTAYRTAMAGTPLPAEFTTIDDAMKAVAQSSVALFYNTYYRSATSPITQSIVDAGAGYPANASNPGVLLSRAALKAYFIDQAAVSTPGTGGATGATGTSTTGTPANPTGASSTTNASAAPAPGLYIQLKTEFDTKKAAYDDLVAAISRSTNPTDEDITQLRTKNRELFSLLEQTIRALSTIQSEEIGTLNRELEATLDSLERQYSILSENKDKVETLRRIREFEEVKRDGSVEFYMILLLVFALAVLIIMMFSGGSSQRMNVPAAAASMSPPRMANFA